MNPVLKICKKCRYYKVVSGEAVIDCSADWVDGEPIRLAYFKVNKNGKEYYSDVYGIFGRGDGDVICGDWISRVEKVSIPQNCPYTLEIMMEHDSKESKE